MCAKQKEAIINHILQFAPMCAHWVGNFFDKRRLCLMFCVWNDSYYLGFCGVV